MVKPLDGDADSLDSNPIVLLALIVTTTILRKVSTAAHLLATSGGLRKAAEASVINLRLLNILCHRGRPFHYIARDGSRFVCIPKSRTSVHHYLSPSCYEDVELRICRQWLRPGDACLDVGANIGFMTASFATCVGPKGLVISVEPAPATQVLFRQAMQLLDHHNIVLDPVCVADQSGEVPFMVPTSDEGSDPLASMKSGAEKTGQFTEIIIPAVTIDSLVEKYGIANRLSLVKIDVEGTEALVLHGGSQLFAHDRLPLFIVEVAKGQLANFGFKPLDVLRFFPDELFELFHVQRSRSDLTPQFEHGRLYALSDALVHDWPWLSNLVAVPRIGPHVNRRSAIAKFFQS